MHDVYEENRKMFQHYRKLCDIGASLLLITLTKEEKAEVKERYSNEDIVWLKIFLRGKTQHGTRSKRT